MNTLTQACISTYLTEIKLLASCRRIDVHVAVTHSYELIRREN